MGLLRDHSEDEAPRASAPTATFHARVAGVGLVTTVVVLLAACLTFMLQQWAVARTQSHRFHEELTVIAAQVAAPSMSSNHSSHLARDLEAVKVSKDVRSARLVDAAGRELAGFRLTDRPTTSTETIEQPVVHEGKTVGRITSAAAGGDGAVALAYVRREVPEDAELAVGPLVATPLH